ncbi:MAG: hypothetical protein AB1567_12355 [bacterium]
MVAEAEWVEQKLVLDQMALASVRFAGRKFLILEEFLVIAENVPDVVQEW